MQKQPKMNCQCANTESVIVGALTTESHLIHDAFMLGPPGSNLSAVSASFASPNILETFKGRAPNFQKRESLILPLANEN